VTDTQDADGEVMETRPVPPLTEADVLVAIKTFLGDQYQTPPMYSAIKINGVPLYKSARKGEEVVREPRFIRVMNWIFLRFAPRRSIFGCGARRAPTCARSPHDLGGKARLRRASVRAAPHGDRQFNVSQDSRWIRSRHSRCRRSRSGSFTCATRCRVSRGERDRSVRLCCSGGL